MGIAWGFFLLFFHFLSSATYVTGWDLFGVFFPFSPACFFPGAAVGSGNVWDTLFLQVDSWAGGSALLVWEGCFAVAFPALCVSRILPSLLLFGEAEGGAGRHSELSVPPSCPLSPACSGSRGSSTGAVFQVRPGRLFKYKVVSPPPVRFL